MWDAESPGLAGFTETTSNDFGQDKLVCGTAVKLEGTQLTTTPAPVTKHKTITSPRVNPLILFICPFICVFPPSRMMRVVDYVWVRKRHSAE